MVYPSAPCPTAGYATARMAESVDALVSNTSGAIRAGSIPAPGTEAEFSEFSGNSASFCSRFWVLRVGNDGNDAKNG